MGESCSKLELGIVYTTSWNYDRSLVDSMISVSLTALNAYENSGSGLCQSAAVHKVQDGSKNKAHVLNPSIMLLFFRRSHTFLSPNIKPHTSNP